MSTNKNNKAPVHTTKHVYKAYTKRLLKENPEWWGRFEKRISNYRVFRKEGTKVIEVISYPRFRAIIETWFRKAQDHIINGEALVLGHNLGRIAARRVERNYNNKVVNWEASNAMWERKGERKGLVYWLDEEWIRIGWNKPGKVKHEKFYRFTPAEGNERGEGFKQRFTQANQEDKTLRFKYEFHPYIRD